MSQASLRTFLNKLHKEASTDIKYSRATTSKVKSYILELNREDLRVDILAQLFFDGIVDAENDKDLNLEINKYFSTLKRFFNKPSKSKNIVYKSYYKNSKTKIKVRATTTQFNKIDIFKRVVANKKRAAQKTFYAYLITYYEKKDKQFNKSKFLDVTSRGSSAVLKKRAATALKRFSKSTSLESKEVKDLIDQYALKLSIAKYNKSKTIEISLGSAYVNQRVEKTQELRDTKEAMQKLRLAIKNLNIFDLKDPESFRDISRKEVIRTVTNPFKKIKGAKVKTEDIKIKSSSSKKVSKILIPKISGETVGLDTAGKIPKPKTIGSRFNLKSLIPLINMKLHDQIKHNMGSPALNYRTGRFAKSAEVVDIVSTAKGNASIHYTYQKYPYSIFESGSGSSLATPARDPRIVIGNSAREIALELVKLRFYFKRI
jgi:hypothetical protein